MDIQVFEGPGIGAAVMLPGRKHGDYLDVGEQGVLAIPDGLKPAGFHLVLFVPEEARTVISQKNVGQEKGGYHHHTLAQFGANEDVTTWIMHDPIQVIRAGEDVWTSWHSAKPNRLDCWLLDEGGHVDLFQVGVITHDNGRTFRLLGEYRWRGRLFQNGEQIFGKPEDPKWGAFDIRRSILNDPDFQKLLQSTKLPPWNGKPEELNPSLDSVPGPGFARMQWYSVFAGQTGQGPAVLHDGSPVWVHGADLLEPPDADGIKRLERNDLVRYAGTHEHWGTKKNGPPKLIHVKVVH